VNGVLVKEIKIPPLIVTLATMEIIRGLVYTITGAIPIREGFTDAFRFMGNGSIGPIPFPVIMMAAVFIIGGVILSKTVYGRHIYCVGGNQEVARLSGINVKKIKYSVYTISGLLAGLAGVLLLGRMGSAQPKAALGYEFQVITACVLGGVSISGGEGKLWRVLFGVIIMGVLFNGLIQIGLNEFVQMMIKGGVLLVAVGIDAMSQVKKQNLVELKLEIAKKEGK
jgi:ribose/xylose/arabinose/galactoside ABC-type transport system permease subunit